jgi:hypothetical protein
LAGTIIEVEIAQPLSSKVEKPGEQFALRLAQPITVNGSVVAPAGVTGVGEVIDAGKSKFGGKPGKLVLAARYLDVSGTRVLLRGLDFSRAGDDRTGESMVITIAVGLPGLFVHGGEVEIPAGVHAIAKIANDATLPPAAVALPPPSNVQGNAQ